MVSQTPQVQGLKAKEMPGYELQKTASSFVLRKPLLLSLSEAEARCTRGLRKGNSLCLEPLLFPTPAGAASLPSVFPSQSRQLHQ